MPLQHAPLIVVEGPKADQGPPCHNQGNQCCRIESHPAILALGLGACAAAGMVHAAAQW